jgi:phosphatidate cytidylyltransferase
MEKIHKIVFHPYVKLGFMVLGYGLMLWFCGSVYKINGYGLRENISLPVSAAGFALLIIGIFQKARIGLKSFGAAALGLLYISLSWGLMMFFYGEYDIHLHDTMLVFDGTMFPIRIIASIWINDTMAYIVGSLIGKTPFSKISPKKTWEGTIGGIILSVIVTGLLFSMSFTQKNNPVSDIFIIKYLWYEVALVAALAGTFGDLLESWLKRKAGVKDSGHIMPGHGGFLDRFDSLLLAVPAVWVFLIFYMINLSNHF